MSEAPAEADAPLRLQPRRDLDWQRILVVFLRVLALLSLVRGLAQWGTICGVRLPPGTGFEDLAPGVQVATVFFAVMELVAGVGLWLTAAWGAVVWIIVALIALVLDGSAFFGVQGWVQLVARPELVSISDLVLIGFYALAARQAARQADARADNW